MSTRNQNPKLETRNSKLIGITSRDNSLLRRARSVRDGKVDELIFVEGLRLCEEALTSGLHIEVAIYSAEIARKDRAARLIEKLARAATKSASVSEKLLASVSYTKTPQGIVVLAARPADDEEGFTSNQPVSPFLVILHELNNPVNVGAILRTAEAAGVTGVIATADTCDPFSPKALRGAMGSAFRMPIWSGARFAEAIAWCKARKIPTFGAAAGGSKSYTDVDWRQPSALIVGRESTGLSQEETAAADNIVRIPMLGATESLNVAVAAGIILYEAARQRAQK
jgi:TrmH family RNA methyltransferase